MTGQNFIIWKVEYSVGNDELDEHHRQLCLIIDNIYQLLQNDGARTEIQKLLHKVVAYGHFHFQIEENILQAAQYPKLSEHQKIHQTYNNEIETRDTFPIAARKSIFQTTKTHVPVFWKLLSCCGIIKDSGLDSRVNYYTPRRPNNL